MIFWQFLKRDLCLASRNKGVWLTPLLFFWLVTALFPLAVSPDPDVLAPIASGVLWVAALLSTLLGLHFIFQTDFEDGSLDQMMLSPLAGIAMAASKAWTHWLVAGLPLVVVAPVLSLMLQVSLEHIPWLMLALLLGTPTLSLLGTVGAALTLGLSRGGLVLPILILPLYIPVLIFGSSVLVRVSQGFSVLQPLAFLGSVLALSLFLAPVMTFMALQAKMSR